MPRSPKHLSGGEKSRVALGRALLSSPDILLLDEPLASLDAARRADILPWLERLRDIARIPIFYVSHALDEVARLADRVVLLDHGRVTAEGSVFELLAGQGAEKPLGAVLEATVGRHRRMALPCLPLTAASCWWPRRANRESACGVRIGADEILVAREAPVAISANNILPVTVSGLRAGRHAGGSDHALRRGQACGPHHGRVGQAPGS